MSLELDANYVATKSGWRVVTFWRILFAWLIIPVIVMICQLIILKSTKIYFFDNKIITKSGILSKNETECAFMGINAVSVRQSFLGRIFNYGDVYVDVVGKWNVNTRGVKNPRALKDYLSKYTINKYSVNTIMNA